MLIPELYSSHLAVQPQTGSASLRAWTTGQILEATVVRQALDGTVTLRIGNQEVQARSGLALAADQPLTVQVAQSGTQTVLRVLNVSTTAPSPDPAAARAANTQSPELATLAQAWRQVLPRDGDLAPLLARFTALPSTPGGAETAALPAPLAQALRQLNARLPALETLFTAAGLKRAVGDSGIFLESHLAQAAARGEAPAVANDFKAGLLVLVRELQTQAGMPAQSGAASGTPGRTDATSLPPALAAASAVLKDADAALARVEQHQLANLSQPADTPPAWLLEVPMRDGAHHSVLRLRIEGDDSGRGEAAASVPWSVWLDFDLAPLGALHARVLLQGERITASLWAEQPETAGFINRHLDELGEALRAAGLQPAALSCQAGVPPPDQPAAPAAGLVDEHA
jgi:hypothetical protein